MLPIVAIVGRPNVGKSTLINTWLGEERLVAFDQPGTWSIKYNLVWDRLLGLNVFPQDEMRRELAFYRTKVELYGLPLDNRSTLTKPEWMLWAASLADDRELFEDCVERIVRYANETRSRVPMSDLYLTDSGRKIGFQARSVLGGFFVRFGFGAGAEAGPTRGSHRRRRPRRRRGCAAWRRAIVRCTRPSRVWITAG